MSYSGLPRALALSNLPSRADGNDTLLVLDRIGGNLTRSLDAVGDFYGLLFDDAEKAYSFSGRGGSCQARNRLDGTFPRTTPRYDSVIASGRSGWLKLWSSTDGALIGVQSQHERGFTGERLQRRTQSAYVDDDDFVDRASFPADLLK